MKLKDTSTENITDFKTSGVFLALGHIPNTKIFEGFLDMDAHGHLKTSARRHTNIPGVFAAGDVQDTRFRQAITAAGSGCQAAMEVEKYIEHLEE